MLSYGHDMAVFQLAQDVSLSECLIIEPASAQRYKYFNSLGNVLSWLLNSDIEWCQMTAVMRNVVTQTIPVAVRAIQLVVGWPP